MREQAFLNAGIHIQISDERDPDNIICENFCYEGGISSFVEYLNKKKAVELVHPDIIHFSTVADDDQATAEVAMQYNDSYNELILSFANNIHTTDGGTHEEGFKRSLTRVMNDYARKYNLLKDSDKNLTGDDVREGLTVVISIKVKDAQFEGQTKSKIGQYGNQRACQQYDERQTVNLFGRKSRNCPCYFLIKLWQLPVPEKLQESKRYGST